MRRKRFPTTYELACIAFRAFDTKMKMVGHQAESINKDPFFIMALHQVVTTHCSQWS
jgi:hypothetical protein